MKRVASGARRHFALLDSSLGPEEIMDTTVTLTEGTLALNHRFTSITGHISG